MARVCVSLLLLAASLAAVANGATNVLWKVAAMRLLKELGSEQEQTGANYSFPVLAKQRGLWPVYIHNNFWGNATDTVMRKLIKVYDDNSFTNIWILQLLLEADDLAVVSVPESMITDAIAPIAEFRDKNFDASMRYSFWPQINSNGTWSAKPSNLNSLIGTVTSSIDGIGAVIKKLFGQAAAAWWANKTSSIVDALSPLKASWVPPDFDTSYCNVALGDHLMSRAKKFPEAYQMWSSYHSEEAARDLDDALRYYAYEPYGDDADRKTIIPRSYYFLHNLTLKPSNRITSIPTTWVQSASEAIKGFGTYSMPYCVNEIDATVSANVLLGLTARIASGTENKDWLLSVLPIYTNTSTYLHWVLTESQLHERPDLALPYYNSVYQLYWFTSRTLHYISNLVASGAEVPAVLLETHSLLSEPLQGRVTDWVLSQRVDGSSKVYWEQWLGNGDKDLFGKPVKLGEDRIFTTSIVLNLLFDIWTTTKKDNTLSWAANTPDEVKSVCKLATNYIAEEALAALPSWENAFFKDPITTWEGVPWRFPANVVQFLNGTLVPDGATVTPGSTSNVVELMVGTVEKEKYEYMLHHHRWAPTPTTFSGFNNDPTMSFVYWSCPSMTKATALLAVSRSSKLF